MTQDFASLGLPAKLLQALARMQFTAPTPIQAQAIPPALEGRDILGSAQTGTGKTAAFGIPLIAKLMENPSALAVILTPTRELATQVEAALRPMIAMPDIKTALLIGGEPMGRQLRQLGRRPRLIVGTPGRVNDHLKRRTLDLRDTAFLVLDETDRMLDMGFGVQIEAIRKFMPEKVQTLLFSATLPHNIVKLSGKYLTNPARIAVGQADRPAENIRQEIVRVADAEKHTELLAQLEKRSGSIIIFVKTKYGTERLARKLNAAGYSAAAIHGDLAQRKREKTIQAFRDRDHRILVATDIAARGLDIPHIEHVINYDLPQCPEDYIHRIGRTARAGAEGEAVALVAPADSGKWRAILALLPKGGSDLPHVPYEAAEKKPRDYARRKPRDFKPRAFKPGARQEARAEANAKPRPGKSYEGRPHDGKQHTGKHYAGKQHPADRREKSPAAKARPAERWAESGAARAGDGRKSGFGAGGKNGGSRPASFQPARPAPAADGHGRDRFPARKAAPATDRGADRSDERREGRGKEYGGGKAAGAPHRTKNRHRGTPAKGRPHWARTGGKAGAAR
jgi:superfamily II DNA/RNA helicase